MRITLFIGTLQGGGAERVVANLANYLAQKGHDVTILNTFENQPVYSIREDVRLQYLITKAYKKNIIHKGLLFLSQDNVAKRKMREYIKQNETDCYVTLLEHPTIYLLSNKKYIPSPVIISERNYPGVYPQRMKKTLFRLSKFADGYVFQTSQARQWYGTQIENAYVAIIPNAINEEFLQYEPPRVAKRNVIVSVGRLAPQKNQKLLIRAFSQIVKEFPEYTLEIYGQGPEKENLVVLAKELGIEDRVRFKGFSKDIKSQICDARLFVLTSDFEGLPNSLIEAMALGLPCVTTDFAGGGAQELITDGEDGIIVKAGDEKAVISAIRQVLSDETLAHSLGEKAQLVKTRLDPERIYNEWEKAIMNTVSQWRDSHAV